MKKIENRIKKRKEKDEKIKRDEGQDHNGSGQSSKAAWSVLMNITHLGMKSINTISQRTDYKGHTAIDLSCKRKVGIKNKWGNINKLKPVKANGVFKGRKLAIKGGPQLGKVKSNPDGNPHSRIARQSLISRYLEAKQTSQQIDL